MNALVWFAGLFGAAAITSSVLLAALLGGPSRAPGWTERLHPRVRAWLLFWCAPVPLLAGLLVLAATFVPHPWLGLPDHCTVAHAHMHLCLTCGLPTPPLAMTVGATFFLVWMVARVGRVVEQLSRARRGIAKLARLGSPRGSLSVVPVPGLAAFVTGFLRPRVFVSEAVNDARWTAVIAHERDHAKHRDPLARLLARLALSVAAPGIGGWLERRLVRAQELAADEAAAVSLGDRVEVAQQVLAWAGAQAPLAMTTSFGHGDLDERVRVLVDPPHYSSGPTKAQIGSTLAAATLLLISLAPTIHHGVEELVHLLQH